MLALTSCAVGVFDQPFGVWLLVDALCAVLLVTAGVAVLRARRGQPRGILPVASLLVLSLAACSVLTTVWTAVAALTYAGGRAPSVSSWPVPEAEAVGTVRTLGPLLVLVTVVVGLGFAVRAVQRGRVTRR